MPRKAAVLEDRKLSIHSGASETMRKDFHGGPAVLVEVTLEARKGFHFLRVPSAGTAGASEEHDAGHSQMDDGDPQGVSNKDSAPLAQELSQTGSPAPPARKLSQTGSPAPPAQSSTEDQKDSTSVHREALGLQTDSAQTDSETPAQKTAVLPKDSKTRSDKDLAANSPLEGAVV